MTRYVIGKFGRNAIQQFAKDLHQKRIHGQLSHINPREEKQIVERMTKIFAKDGKAPFKIRERDIEKEILNPLRIKTDDSFDRGEVEEIDKGFGFTEHTKQVGSKYADALKQGKRDEYKKRIEEAAKAKAEALKSESCIAKKPDRTVTRISKWFGLGAVKNNEIAESDASLGGNLQDKYARSDAQFGGVNPSKIAEVQNRLGSTPRNQIKMAGGYFNNLTYDKPAGENGKNDKGGIVPSESVPEKNE